jgi:soluble lytic murein transglycosylase
MAEYDDPMLMDALGNPMIPDPNSVESMIEAYKRLQRYNKGSEEAKPVTQTIKTDPKTGEQTMTVSGSVQDLGPGNPLAPTVMPALQNRSMPAERPRPVAPSAVFDRMIQAESNGQQFNPQGGVLTSPRGAQGMAQIMPSTAANPGYGVRPATPEEIATPEGNRAFGERYYQGLLQHFGGDEQKAIAAYNAGPGRVQQNMQANGGQLNVAQLPQETQGYLRKVQGPAVPGMQPSPMIAGTASSDVGLTPTEQAIAQMSRTPGFNSNAPRPAEVPQWQQAILSAGNDPRKLAMVMAGDFPDEAKTLAQNLIVQSSLDQKQKLDATKTLQNFATGNISGRDIDQLIKSKGEEGSYVKAVLFAQLGLTDLAKQEQAKIGNPVIGKAMIGNKSYLTESKGGVVINAYDDKGTAVTPETLATLNAEPTDTRIHSSTQMYDPVTRQYVTKQELASGQQRYMAGGKPFQGDATGLVDAHQYNAQENRRVNGAYSNLAKLTAVPTDEQKFSALRQAGVPPERIEEELGLPPGTLRRQQSQTRPGVVPTGPTMPQTAPSRAPAAPVAPGAAVQAPVPQTRTQPAPTSTTLATAQAELYEAPVQRPGEANEVYKKRLSEYDRFVKSKQGLAEKFVENAPTIQQTLSNIRQGYDAVVDNQVNLGPSLGIDGAGPLPKVQQFFGEMIGSDESANTTLVRSLMNRQGLEGLKQAMGPQISNFDVQSWMANNPIKENSPPEKIAEYLQKLHNEIQQKAEQSKANAVRLGYMPDNYDLGSPITKSEKPAKSKEKSKDKPKDKPQGKGTKDDPIKL